jgi:hypothetical protein
MLGLLEPLLERVVFEDVPTNLAAVKRRAEELRLSRQCAELEAQGTILDQVPNIVFHVGFFPDSVHVSFSAMCLTHQHTNR